MDRDLRTTFGQMRPWLLRVAALLRVVVIFVAGGHLVHAGWPGMTVLALFGICALGLWRRRIWPWRIALLVDIALVVYYAVKLIDTGDIQLFSYISATAVFDIVLLGLGQETLIRPGPPQ
jgi:hypothetical protein